MQQGAIYIFPRLPRQCGDYIAAKDSQSRMGKNGCVFFVAVSAWKYDIKQDSFNADPISSPRSGPDFSVFKPL
jgi:hypothetical protein